jgi:hypothetical protein
VNQYLISMIALDVARERTREAEEHYRARQLTAGRPSIVSRGRRQTARLLASVSLGSAAVVRRLDTHVADDLGRTLAAE